MGKPARKAGIQALVRQAALWRGCTIALYGGSFNPAHEGHLHVAKEVLKRLDVDAVWLMVSPRNPLKAKGDIARYKKRRKSLQKLIAHHPKLHISDIEKKLGTRYTADTLDILIKTMPGTRFIWVMGADSLANFHHWYRWQHITDSLSIAVFDRPGYSIAGLVSKMARRYRHSKVPARLLGKTETPAWAYVTMPRHPASATQIRELKSNRMRAGSKRKES